MEPIEAREDAPAEEIELGQVERALAALWAGAAPEDPGAEPAVLRACALNLVVLSRSPADLDRVRPIAAQTTVAHPSRILLLVPDETGEPASPQAHSPSSPVLRASSGVGARIRAFCHRLGGGGRHVCCEEITLLARGSAAERLREAALPLLLPDLPVHLWIPAAEGQTTGDGTAQEQRLRAERGTAGQHARHIDSVAELADEVIWSARRPGDELPASSNGSRPPAVVDLDWLRLRPWCELTAQLFDTPEHGPLLARLERVEVVIAGTAAPGNRETGPGSPHDDIAFERPGAGWLCVGWLASRLGWRLMDGATGGHRRADTVRPAAAKEIQLTAPAGPITVTVVPTDDKGVAAGDLTAVRLQARGREAPLVLERHPGSDPTDLWIMEESARCVHFGRRDEAVLLGEALEGAARDPVYEAAWEMAVRLWAA